MPPSPLLDTEGVLHVNLSSNGQPVGERVELRSVRVRRAVGRIPSAQLVLAQAGAALGEWPAADDEAFQPGALVRIAAGYGSGADEPLFEGVMVRLGLQVSGDNDARLVVECRHRAVAMTLAPRSAHYSGQPVSATIRGLLEAHALTAEVDEVVEAGGAVTQYQRTDWDFMRARAQAHGLLVIADDDRVRVQTPCTSAAAVLKVEHGIDLIDCQAEVDARSQQQTRLGLAPVHGRMRFQGSAAARVGTLIELAGLGARNSGKVFVAEVEHEITDGHWLTTAGFGLPPEWQPAHGHPITKPTATGPLPGLQIGVVTRLGDPAGEQRVQVRLPALLGAASTVWARTMQPQASSGFGAFLLPEVGDEVVVDFCHQDPSQPVVLGSLYSSSRPPPYAPEDANDIKALVTRCRHRLEFDENHRTITLTTPANNRVVLSDEGGSVTLSDQHGSRVELGASGVSIDTLRDLRVKAGGSIRIEAVGAMSITTQADLSCTGLNIACAAQVGFSGKGVASAELSAAGQTVVKGGLVLIN